MKKLWIALLILLIPVAIYAGDSAITGVVGKIADSLTSDPTDCSANQFANAIDTGANLTCAALTDADVPNNITVDTATNVADTDFGEITVSGGAWTVEDTLTVAGWTMTSGTFSGNFTGGLTGNASTSTALASNPTDCSANNYATSIDANGNLTCGKVAVAGLANGTDGELITWSAAAAPTTVAAGTSGQVLTSNGAGAAPTFQDAGGGNATKYYSFNHHSTSLATGIHYGTPDTSLLLPSSTSNAANMGVYVPFDGVLKDFRVRFQGSAVSGSSPCRLYKDSTIVYTVTKTNANSGSWTTATGTTTVNAGQMLKFYFNMNGAMTNVNVQAAVTLEPN